MRDALLVLADGEVFEGEAIGAPIDISSGEVVFNTVLSGYQEVITDPSYAGQIITFTTPHIGNYGTNIYDAEARRTFARGIVVREMARRSSNFRSDCDLDASLRANNMAGIGGIDTRRLTRHLRDAGASAGAFGTADHDVLLAAARNEPGTTGVDLVNLVTTPAAYTVPGDAPRTIVAMDYGLKFTILRHLATLGTVHVLPAHASHAEIMSYAPDGIFLSNGPGDPALVNIDAITATIGQVPMFGICLGHQLIARAIGGATFKLPFGHHGGNHPVKRLHDGVVEITSQNHNFCVDPSSLEGRAEVTHINLNDMTNEGMRVTDGKVFSVQYHPEAGPGPHDSRYLFDQFAALMDDGPRIWTNQRTWLMSPPKHDALTPALESTGA
jgi:carbamoyl-phosphate synthase small subunit